MSEKEGKSSGMVDLGKALEGPAVIASQEGESAQHLNYPEVHIENDQIPISQEHLNKHVRATVQFHVKGIEHTDDGKGGQNKRVHLAMKSMQIHPETDDNSGDEMTEKVDDKHERLEKIKKDYMKEEA
jgi:hypothetical protein